MKTRLNIICILIFLAIAWSVVNYFYNEKEDFVEGFIDGQNKALNMYEDKTLLTSVFLTMRPDGIGQYPDSLYDSASGKYMPAQYRQVVVKVEDHANTGWSEAVYAIMALFVLASVIAMAICFLKLIYAINKSKVFDWTNVLKLRIIGIAMFVLFICDAIISYMDYYLNVAQIDVKGYVVHGTGISSFSLLLPALIILLIAEIFAMGLRLKEEQDLTI